MKLRTLSLCGSALGLMAIAACGSSSSGTPDPNGQDAGFDSGSTSSGTSGTSGTDSGGNDGTAPTDAGGDTAEAGYTGPAHFMYVAGKLKNTSADVINGYTLDPTTGAFAPFDVDDTMAGSQSSIAAGQLPSAIALTPSGSFLYAPDDAKSEVWAFKVNTTTGALTPIDADAVTAGVQPFPLPADSSPEFAIVEPTGKHLYVSNSSHATIAIFDIDAATGALTAQAVPTIATLTGPRGMAVSVAGDLLFVAEASANGVSSFTIDAATGALTSAGTITIPGSPIGVVHHPTKKVIYVTSSEGASVYAISYDATGALTSLGSVAAGMADGGAFNTPLAITVDPTGTFAYAPNLNEPLLNVYPLDAATGALGTTAVTTTMYEGVQAVSVDTSGKYLVVSGDTELLRSFAIGAAGALTAVPNPVEGSINGFANGLVVSH